MADLNEIPFGGLAALDNPHLLKLNQALIASDCYMDDSSIFGRNGYRSALPGAVTNSGTPQHLGRYRPIAASQRFVVVIGGNIYLIKEPSSETASDGTSTLIGSGTFGAADLVSGSQLGANYYLVNNQTPATAIRINSGYTIEALVGLPQPAMPSFSQSGLELIYLSSLTAAYSGITSGSSGVTTWEELSGTTGSTAQFDLATGGGPAGGYAWQNTQWLMVTCSPETISGGNTNFQVSLRDVSSNVYPLGTISDPPNTDGSPWCVFFNLSGLGITANIQYLTFTQGVKASGSGADPFCISAIMAFPTAPEPGTVDYYVTYYNSVTGVESTLSTPLAINYSGAPPFFPAIQVGRWNYNTFQNLGLRSINPETMTSSDMFNKGTGLAYPKSTDFAPVSTFSGTIPTDAQFPNADTVRLYRTTPVGISLVGSSIYTTRADGSAWTTGTGTASDFPQNYTFQTAGGTAWSITDNTGSTASANPTYVAGGPFPPATQMSAYAGRLCIIYENQVSFSSFTPVGVNTNPVPQWPPIAIEADDGWSYDVSPAPTEVGVAIDGTGDAVYIGTSEMVRSMSDVTPNSPPFVILRRGVIGRFAYGFFETSFFWAAWDGIYMAQNQSGWVELSQEIRTYYLNVFQPDATVHVRYQDRKLYIFKGQKMLRFDFVKKRWSTGTIADSVAVSLCWADVIGVEDNDFIVDTFQGSQGTLLSAHAPDVGSTWVQVTSGVSGDIQLTGAGSAQPRNSLPNSGMAYINTAAPPSADYSVSADWFFATTTGALDENMYMIARCQDSAPVANNTYYQLSYVAGGSDIQLNVLVAGLGTLLGSAAFAPVAGQTYLVALQCIADQISVLLNGATIIGPITNSAITLAGHAGIGATNAGPGFTPATGLQFQNFTAGNGTITRTRADQLWIIPTSRLIGRWQTDCTEDMQIGTTPNSGAAIPAWVFSTGFQAAVPSPNTVIGLQLDASGPVSVQIAKVADAIVPTSARNLFTADQPGIDECWFPGCPDFRGFKMRFQFTAQNSVTLRRANYEGLLLPGTKGG